MKKLPPLKFIPQPKERIWGGDNLKNKLKKPFLGNNIGENILIMYKLKNLNS